MGRLLDEKGKTAELLTLRWRKGRFFLGHQVAMFNRSLRLPEGQLLTCDHHRATDGLACPWGTNNYRAIFGRAIFGVY